MSLNLSSATVDDQALTPTPGSPRPYLSSDNHDRLNSIQLSSDASGEFSTTHSPRSFLGPPGEALSELRNALNPPWHHGLTGTPPSLMGVNRTDQACQWVDDALRIAERSVAVEVGTNVDLATLSLAVVPSPTARTSKGVPPQASPIKINPLMMRSSGNISNSHSGRSSEISGKMGKKQSPFDKQSDGVNSHYDPNSVHPMEIQPIIDTLVSKAHDSRSGDGSSEEEEAWPMPATPFLNDDLWNKSTHRSRFIKESQPPHENILHQDLPEANHVKPTTTQFRKNGGGGRAIGLLGPHRAKEGERRVGRCKMYNCDKGVGFLIDDRLDEVPYDELEEYSLSLTSPAVKIHWTDLYSDQEFKSLAKGELVEYTLNITSNGFSASYVTGPGGRPVMGAEQTIVQASRQTSYKLFKAGVLPVKTYRSKWENVAAGMAGNTELPLSSTTPYVRPGAAHSKSQTFSERQPSSMAFGDAGHNHNKNVKVEFQLVCPNFFTFESTWKARLLPSAGVANASMKCGHFAKQKRVTDALNPTAQLSTPSWSSIRSSLNVIPTPSSLHSYGTSSQTPLLGFSHASLTPKSVESIEPLILSGYPSQNATTLSTMRSPSVQITSPGDLSKALFPNRLINNANSCINPRDIQNFFAERQLLLQHQAALVSLYQNVNSNPAGLDIQNNIIHSKNLSAKYHIVNPAQSQQYYTGLYERANSNVEPQSSILGLLPPIVLPNGKVAIDSEPSFAPLHKGQSHGVWRSAVTVQKVDNSASLRPSAQAFMPAGGEMTCNQAFSSNRVRDEKASNPEEVGKILEGPVYQAPGRRSVSDPASNGTGCYKKPGTLINLPGRHNKLDNSSNRSSGKLGAKLASAKRVTFAEQTTAPRRIVSYGETPSPAVTNYSSPSEGDTHDEVEVYSESAEESIHSKAAGNNRRIRVEHASIDEVRRNGDVKSVEIAMERLREAAAPRRLSNVTSSVTQTSRTPPPPSNDPQVNVLKKNFITHEDILDSTTVTSTKSFSDVPPDRFNLSSVIKETSSMLAQLQV
ncbi:hypothetical protein PPACK8108_LOCUS19640 [Phakopsora pachyrhizi]|uniref:Uncharacterized protein n=1 Tax=Phakopsora pachyrhizi TaxID=170000 RepID=A0AAV0BG14_PHAPC|nr:hypothetical protein PPACK8108_LOCUS19640 [Phakopsora pachyrhizi]